ncbi:hypothetical protein [Flavobacterium sp.]|uniref:hypothetical protein n=1 Tax=Flavobacterium sp. TaxID=239 RepID=UPI00286CD345|nr:hypothetical protein [Flavobacterium sp.]
MKSILKNIIAICLLMYTITTYSQVNVAVSGMTYISGTPISNCGNIDFGTNPTVRVQFGITLTKPTNQVVGVSNLYVYSIGSSGSRIERKNEIVQPTSFDTYYTSSGDITMSESDFNTSGGTLFAIFKSSSNIEYQTTCSYTITKTLSPTFSLLPTSLSLACGDTSAKTFTVTPANIPNGATLTYNWSYSSSGWSGSTSNTNSITLSPSSGSNLPTNVSVTPVLNGVAQPTKTCIVTRAPFTQTAAIISGGNSICTPATSGVYSISNQGTNTVTWSSSNTAIATVSSTTEQVLP